MPCLLIADGFTLTASIPENGPFPALSFDYRPALPDAVDEYLRGPRNPNKPGEPRAKLLMKYLASWDVTDATDKPIPIDLNALARVPHPYLEAMARYITTYATDGAHEADAKNSVTG